MYVHVVGGGPAGLVFAQMYKSAAGHAEVVVSDRSGGRCPRGFGVLLSESTRRRLSEVAPDVYRNLEPRFVRWDMLEVHRAGERIAMHGHDYAAISRPRLLSALGDRCESLGVVLKTEDMADLPRDSELVVAAEGIGSGVRERLAGPLGARVRSHTPRFCWFGTPRLFHCLTFVIVEGPVGLFQAHAYPVDDETSAFIVQCGEESWYEAGFDTATPEESAARCAEIFRESLDGEPLLVGPDQGWRRFATVSCRRFSAGNVVVVGDAAHTVHWSIGSGTKVAVDDGTGLAQALAESRTVTEGLARYELARQGPVERLQRAAARSADYFDNLDRFREQPPRLFAFNLYTRSGRLNHRDVWARDRRYAAGYDRWFAGRDGDERLVAPPPAHTPLTVRGIRLANRAVDRVPVHLPEPDPAVRVTRAAAGRPGLLLLDRLAVSGDGAWHGAPVLDGTGTAAVTGLIRAGHQGGARVVGVVLDHAGPFAGRSWTVGGRREPAFSPMAVAASAVPADRYGRTPRELPGEETGKVVSAFVSAAGAALRAGADALFVNMAHGNLLATFVSPLLNRRADEYGGPAEQRIAFPVAVVAAIRRAHPSALLGAVVSADDGIRGGVSAGDAATLVNAVCGAGVDMVVVEAGQGTGDALVWSDQVALLGCADRVRAAGAPVVVLGGLTLDSDELSTVVGAGRADLCVVGQL